jgi:hypothetical protein
LIGFLIFSGVLVLLVVVVGGVVAYKWYDVPRVAATLPEVAQEYRERGLPWEASDLEPDPPVAEHENAAPLIRAAIEKFDYGRAKKEASELIELVRSSNPRNLDEVDQRIKPYEPALALAEQASERPRCWFHRDWDLGAHLLLPEYAHMQEMIRLFAVKAEAAAQRGRGTEAVRYLRAGLNLAKHAGSEPTMLAALVQTAGETTMMRSSEHVMASFRGDMSTLQEVRMALKPDERRVDIRRAFRGEMFLGIATTRNLHLARKQGEAKSENLERTGFPKNPAARAYMARHMQAWIDADKAAEGVDDPVAMAALKSDVMEEHGSQRTLSSLLNAVLLPVFTQAGQAVGSIHVKQDLTYLLAQAMEFEARHGRFPNSLEELGSAPSDPFGEDPLRLVRSDKGIGIYSVGPNGRDDGGVSSLELPRAPQGANRFAQGDVVAAYPPKRERLAGND